jgi:Domain of unknown function (DUF4349)
METRRDDFDLTAELRALRPSPSAAFADELDARAAVGFAKDEQSRKGPFSAIAKAIRGASPRRLALPAGATALAALVLATAVIAINQEDHSSSGESALLSLNAEKDSPAGGGEDTHFSDTPSTLLGGRPPTATSKSASGAGEASAGVGVPAGSSAGYQLEGAPQPRAGADHRAIERDAELVLRTQPGEVGKASREVFGAIHAANGVVLSSSVRDQGGESSARFQLLVPSAQLGDTLASLSQIAEVRSRHESTLDITAPTVSIGDRLKDSEATIEGMLTQLGAAESYGERALLERQLRHERQRAAVLRSRLDQLRRRADFARISLRIESGSDAGAAVSGRWGVDDALHDAGRILAIAAGVAVIGLAILGPVALFGLLAWLATRIWLSRQRLRALG